MDYNRNNLLPFVIKELEGLKKKEIRRFITIFSGVDATKENSLSASRMELINILTDVLIEEQEDIFRFMKKLALFKLFVNQKFKEYEQRDLINFTKSMIKENNFSL